MTAHLGRSVYVIPLPSNACLARIDILDGTVSTHPHRFMILYLVCCCQFSQVAVSWSCMYYADMSCAVTGVSLAVYNHLASFTAVAFVTADPIL